MNKKVGKGLASAIETGENATQSTKETLGVFYAQITCLINVSDLPLFRIRGRTDQGNG